MTKLLVSSVLAFALGFLSNQLFLKASGASKADAGKSQDARCAELVDAKSTLIAISESEYLEYTKIKDLKQRYEKADELLGKIMLLFLADVGFKSQKITSAEISEGAKVKAAVAPSMVANNDVRVATHQVPSVSPSITITSSSIQTLQTEKQIRDALDKVVIDNPKLEVARGGTITAKQTQLLEGRYRGSINFLDEKRGPLTVVWDLQPDRTKKGLSGTFNLSIHGPGNDSDSSGHGSIDNIVSFSQDPGGFMVSACGNQCYLQLYYNSPSDQFYGNYYEADKNSKAPVQRLGVVELRR